jgi:ABC-2 type transport system ATP-binding protein
MPSNNAAIDSCQLTKAYRSKGPLAVADLTLQIEPGCIFGFLGPNGAGKSTVLKMLLGLTQPSSGAAFLFGRSIRSVRARLGVGYLPELFRYPPWLSAREVLSFHSALAGVARTDRAGEVERVLALVGLSQRAAERVETFSKGMQQRLGIAVALLGRPRLVFLDEPTSALDPVGRVDVREILRTLRDSGTTVFINSHLLTEVEQICDRVAFFRSGRIVAEGSISDIIGTQAGVRVRIGAVDAARLQGVVRPFGNAEFAAGTLSLEDVRTEQVPEVVAALAAAGVPVYEVTPFARTLEERFLELMAG